MAATMWNHVLLLDAPESTKETIMIKDIIMDTEKTVDLFEVRRRSRFVFDQKRKAGARKCLRPRLGWFVESSGHMRPALGLSGNVN